MAARSRGVQLAGPASPPPRPDLHGPDGAGPPPGGSALATAAMIAWRTLVVGVAVFLAVVGLARLRVVVIPLLAALFLATFLVPPAQWLRRRGWPPLLATWAVFVASLVVLGTVGTFVTRQLIAQLGDLASDVRQGVQVVTDWLSSGPLGMSEGQIDRYVDQALDQLRSQASVIAGGVLSGAVLVAEVIAGLLLTVVLVFFFVKDGEGMATWVRQRLPERRRHVTAAAAARAWSTLGAFMRGQALVALIDAVAIGIGLVVIGVPLVVPLMVLTFLGGFLPLVGATLAGLAAVLVALATGGVTDALWTGAVVIGVQQLEGDLVAPLVMRRAVNLHPVVVLLALTAGTVLGGIVGAFIAVPVTAVVVAVVSEVRHQAALGRARDEPQADPATS